VSGGSLPQTLTIDQDAVISVSSVQGGQGVIHKSRPGRKAYLFVITGSLTVNGTPVAAGDQARIADEPELALEAREATELIFLDLP
jgi:hypothetical protein